MKKVEFDQPMDLTNVKIFESKMAGGSQKISVMDANGKWDKIWSPKKPFPGGNFRVIKLKVKVALHCFLWFNWNFLLGVIDLFE